MGINKDYVFGWSLISKETKMLFLI